MKPTVWLVVFVGINFCEMVPNQVSKFFRCFIFVVSESGTQELASCTAKAEQVSTEDILALCSCIGRKDNLVQLGKGDSHPCHS